MAVADIVPLRFPIVFDFKDYAPGDLRYWADTFDKIDEGYTYLGMLRFILDGDQKDNIYIKRSVGWQLLTAGTLNIKIGNVSSGPNAAAEIRIVDGIPTLDLVIPVVNPIPIKITEVVMLGNDASPTVENIGTEALPEYRLGIPAGEKGERGSPFKFDGVGTLAELVFFDQPEFQKHTSYVIVDPDDTANHGWLYLKGSDGDYIRTLDLRGPRGDRGFQGIQGASLWLAYAETKEGLNPTRDNNPAFPYWAHIVATEEPPLAAFTNYVQRVGFNGKDGAPGTGGNGGGGEVCTPYTKKVIFDGNTSFLLENIPKPAESVTVTVEGAERALIYARRTVEGQVVTLPNEGEDELFIGDEIVFKWQVCVPGNGTGPGGSRHIIAGPTGIMPDQPNLLFDSEEEGAIEIKNEVNTTKILFKAPRVRVAADYALGGYTKGETWTGTLQEFITKLFSNSVGNDIEFVNIGGNPADNIALANYIKSFLGGDISNYRGLWSPGAYKAGWVVEAGNGTGLWRAKVDIANSQSLPFKGQFWEQVDEAGRSPYRGVYVQSAPDRFMRNDVIEVTGAGLYRCIIAANEVLTDYTGDPILDTTNWIKIISSTSKAEEFNYTQLETVKNANGLLIGNQYRLMDFRSMGKKSYGQGIWQGPVEPITLTASSPNTFHPVASSSLHPLDVIYFDFNNKVCEDTALTPRKGKIDRRIDPVRRIDISCDYRYVKEDRFKSLGLFHHTAVNNAGNFAATIVYGTVDAVPNHYREYYVYFPAGGNAANPTLTLTKGAAVVTRPIKKVGGTALAANELTTMLSAGGVYHGLALIHYSKKYDCYYIRNNKAENDLFKDKYIGITGADVTNGNGTRILIDPSSALECHMMVSATPDVKNISIGPINGRPYPNIVWLSINGISETQIPEGCNDITFASGLTHDMKMGTDCWNNIFIGDCRWARFGNEFQSNICAGYSRIGLNSSQSKDAATHHNTFLVLSGANYSFEVENLVNNTVRLAVGGTGNKIEWMYTSIINWNAPQFNRFKGNISSKFWEPEANYSEVLYYKGLDITAETFTEPKTDIAILNIDGKINILNGEGVAMPARKNVQFKGMTVTDDPALDATVVEGGAVTGGGETTKIITRVYSNNNTFDLGIAFQSVKSIHVYANSPKIDKLISTPFLLNDEWTRAGNSITILETLQAGNLVVFEVVVASGTGNNGGGGGPATNGENAVSFLPARPFPVIHARPETIVRVKRLNFVTDLKVQINGGAITTLVFVEDIWTGEIAIPADGVVNWIPTSSTGQVVFTYNTVITEEDAE